VDKMTTEYRSTREEETFWRLLNEEWDTMSEAAHKVFEEAEVTSHRYNLASNYAFQPFEYDDAIEKMRRAAADLTDRDCEIFAKLWHAALAAAASVDAGDFETLVGRRAYRGQLHHYYRMVSWMIETTLQKKEYEEYRKNARKAPQDFDDCPF
jgi:hypothetical protein